MTNPDPDVPERPGPPTAVEHDTLTAALAAVQAELPAVAKGETATVPTKSGGTYTYSYTSLADLSQAVLPLLGRHGLAWVCLPTLTEQGAFVLRWQLRHTSGELLEGSWLLPTQGGAQVQGSAITYARRYCLLAVTGVAPDDEDDDGAAAQQHAAQPRATQQRPAASRQGGGPPSCVVCETPITGSARRVDGGYAHQGCAEGEQPEQADTVPAPAEPTGEVAELYAEAGPALARLHQLTGGREPYPQHYRALRDLLGGDPRDGAAWAGAESPADVLGGAVADLQRDLANAEDAAEAADS